MALATAYGLADDPLITPADDPTGATVTRVRALHVEQLRAAVDAVRVLAGLNTGAWDETAAVGGLVRAAHVQELRTRLHEALVELSLPLPAYTDAVLSVGVTGIKRAHIEDLRAGATRGSGAGQGGGTGGAVHIQWLVTDHLGTPRIIADLSGSLVGIKRHDYLPFGEEIGAGVGGRTTGQGYSQVDNVRQKFTGKERDAETGLDYFGARYMSSTQGRFTSVDPGAFSKRHIANPQKWNRYPYVLNNPLRFFDPDGMEEIELIIRTFIPQKSVTVPMPVKGDGRDVGERGTSRTEFRIKVETDIRKNNGNIFVGTPQARAGLSEGITVKPMVVPGQGAIPVPGYGKSQVTQADIDKGTEATANRPLKDTVQVTATHAVAYPGAPGTPTIDYNLNLTVVDNNGRITVSAEGMHDGFPAIEIFAVRQGSNQEQLINSYDPRDTGQSGFELIGKPDTKLERRTRELDPVRRP